MDIWTHGTQLSLVGMDEHFGILVWRRVGHCTTAGPPSLTEYSFYLLTTINHRPPSFNLPSFFFPFILSSFLPILLPFFLLFDVSFLNDSPFLSSSLRSLLSSFFHIFPPFFRFVSKEHRC
jgi:hypothetical protein